MVGAGIWERLTIHMKTRKDKLLAGLDVSRQLGAEIGPLGRPLVNKTEGPIIYVDYADTEFLRQKYAQDSCVDTSQIQVDAVWGEQTLQQAILSYTQSKHPVELDYVIASHVIEHVPDLISWLQEIRSILKPTGQLRLAVPDRRFTFDYLRRNSDLPAILNAYVNKARRPNTQCILDFCLNEVVVDVTDAWAGKLDETALQSKHAHTLEGALAVAKDALDNGTYHDIHCWTFTPASLADLFAQLAQHNLLDFACVNFHDTDFNEIEFFVTMQASDDMVEKVESWKNFGLTAKENKFN